MKWINILHFYQPPTQEPEILNQVAQQSYLFLANFLEKNPEFKITLNICGCLTEMLAKNGYGELLGILKNLADKKQIEFTGTAAYHAFLPLLPENEIIYQIVQNEKINKKYFGDSYSPKGFFLPELAYSEKVAKIIQQLGHKWIVLDEISYQDKRRPTPYRVSDARNGSNLNFDKIYKIEKIGLDVIFRNRKISQTYVPETIYNLSNINFNNQLACQPTPQPPLSGGLREFPTDKGGKGGFPGSETKLEFSKRALPNSDNIPEIIITATDSELYGHRYKDNNNFLNKIIESKKVNFLTASEFINSNEKREKAIPINSSWESTLKDLKLNFPFQLWQDGKNKIHQYLWKLANLAVEELYDHQDDKNFNWARHHLNRGLSSCTFWWASEYDLREKFGPVAWNPDLIEKGANELIQCIRSINSLDKNTKIKAEKIYLKIKKMVWIRHWKKYA